MISLYSRAIGAASVNGVPLPGRVRVQGAGAVYQWEVRPGYGRSGAVVVGMGPGISKFTLFVDMWLSEHFVQWEVAKVVLAPPKPLLPTMAIYVSNPILADVGITEIVVEERGQVDTSGAVWTVPIKCMQYRKPMPALVKPRGGIPGAGGSGLAAVTEADKALVDAQAAFAAAKAGG